MKHYLLIILLATSTTYSWCMDTFLRKLAGECIIDYLPTTQNEREEAIQIINSTNKSLILQTTYTCKTQLVYTAILWCHCYPIRGVTSFTECDDTLTLLDPGQTISLVPLQENLAQSRIRATSLKTRFAQDPGDWITHPISGQKRDALYQNQQGGLKKYQLILDENTIQLK